MQDRSTRIESPVVIELPNERDAIGAFMTRLLDEAREAGIKESAAFAIRLAIEEAITNAFVHGHKGMDRDTPIRVEYRVTGSGVDVAVEDRGPGFEPGTLVDPTLDENLDKPSGRGVMLMRAYMHEVEFNQRGNRVLMRYRANADTED